MAVVVPTYNEAENLLELVSRLFSLDLDDLWVYIVDDGSPDGTAEVARRTVEESTTTESRSYPGVVSRD